MILSSFPLLFSLPISTIGNSDNILITFIYYILICILDLVPSQWPYLFLSSFPFCLSQRLTILIIFLQLLFTISLFICRILSLFNIFPFDFLLPALFASTNGNSDNIHTTFTYYVLIYIQNLVVLMSCRFFLKASQLSQPL